MADAIDGKLLEITGNPEIRLPQVPRNAATETERAAIVAVAREIK